MVYQVHFGCGPFCSKGLWLREWCGLRGLCEHRSGAPRVEGRAGGGSCLSSRFGWAEGSRKKYHHFTDTAANGTDTGPCP